MTKRLLTAFLAIALLATACSTERSNESIATGDDSVEDVEPGTGVDPSDPEASTAPAVPEEEEGGFVATGPETTFIPDLEGPFSTDGGAASNTDDSILIIEENPPLTDTLAGLVFPTDWTRRTIEDFNEIGAGLGGPDPRDGIPPLDSPVFESPALAAQWLAPQEPGALVQLNGEARFYPLAILTRHEIVNDAFGDIPVDVTFCPLCNTAIAFDRRVDGEVLRLGVSGLLRNSDLVMWDDATTSLWQQVTGESIVGEFAGTQLESVPTSIVSFQQFVESFPEGLSLAQESGFGPGQYGLNPYAGYSSSATPFLFSGETDDRLRALERVVGISEDDLVVSYSFSDLQANQVVNDEIDGRAITVFWAAGTADALDANVIASSADLGSGVAHDPVVDGQTLTFTANGDGTFTDEQTGSTWTVLGIATDGELEGSQLGPLKHQNEFWFAWQAFFGPDSLQEL